MKKIAFLLFLFSFGMNGMVFGQASSSQNQASSAGNFTIGLGPIGHFYLTDRRPEMSPGVGAIIYFDYRWSPELSTTTTVMMLVSDGKDQDSGQSNIIFMGIPTFDIKYYFLRNPSRWDPFASVGIGYYVLTNGSVGRGTASGLGAQLGVGTNYYISSKFSVGLAGQFRSVAMLGNGATGTFPISFSGLVGYHF